MVALATFRSRSRCRLRLGTVLVALAAALLVLGVAGRARAASNECTADLELASRLPAEPRGEAGDDGQWRAWTCDGTETMRWFSHREVPICLMHGASAIAPMPLLPIDEARLEAARRCGSPDSPDQIVPKSPDRQDKYPKSQGEAVLPESHPRRFWALELGLARAASDTRHAVGHAAGVYRPPR